MKGVFFTFLVAAIVVVQCKHLFLGTNVNRPMVYHLNLQKRATIFRKTIENTFYQVPAVPTGPRAIQGILAVDRTESEASANITVGGIGYNHVNIRMKSERGGKLHYDIYIFV